MKNQLIQALAAIRFADETGRFMELWVNGGRCEQQGDQVLKNLRGLFRNTRHKLVEIPWLARNEFLWVMSGMNVALCDSFSGTRPGQDVVHPHAARYPPPGFRAGGFFPL